MHHREMAEPEPEESEAKRRAKPGAEEIAEPEAAVAIVHARGTPESVLLIRRAERADDSWSGHWSFPGGRRSSGDPGLLETAVRELEEECGIRLACEHLETALPPVVARRKIGPFVLVAPFVFRTERELPTVLDPREAAEALWVPLDIVTDPARHRLCPVPGQPREMLFPAIDLQGSPLWGFTYRLISDWLGLLPSGQAIEHAGFEAAGQVLQFLLSRGLALEHGWIDQAPPEPGQPSARTAGVKGQIPAEEVLGRFSAPGRCFPAVSRLEVRPDSICLAGLAFEEYIIRASV